MENPVNKDYLQRPDKPNHKKKKDGEDEDEVEENSEEKRFKNRNKTHLYKKDIKEIKQFPFMKKLRGDLADDESEDNHDDYVHKQPKRESPKMAPSKKPAPGLDDGGGFFDDL